MIPLKRTLFILIMALYSFPLMAQGHKQERQALESASNLISDRKAEEALVLLVPLRESSFLQHRTEAFRLSGQAMLLTRDYPKAGEFLEKALELSIDLHYLDEQARSAYWLGRTNALQGQMEEAVKLNLDLLDIHPLLYVEGNPAGVKAGLEIMDLCSSEVRIPLVSLSQKYKDFLAIEMSKVPELIPA